MPGRALAFPFCILASQRAVPRSFQADHFPWALESWGRAWAALALLPAAAGQRVEGRDVLEVRERHLVAKQIVAELT